MPPAITPKQNPMQPAGSRQGVRTAADAVPWFCSGSAVDQKSEERATSSEIWLQRHGWHEVITQQCRTVADPLSAVFYNADEAYEVRSRAGVRQAATRIVIESELLETALENCGVSAGRFPRRTVRMGRGVALEHFRLVRLLSAPAAPPHMELEESVVMLTRSLLETIEGHRRSGSPAGGASRRDVVVAVKELIAARYADDLRLADISGSVGISAFHLSRIFSETEGSPIHRYLVKVRLRAALEQLHDRQESLTDIALDSGFSSHSHFTTSFRREFGVTPGELRKERD